MNTDRRGDVGCLDHWKTDPSIATRGADGERVLLRLWIFAARHKPDGRLTGVRTDRIERVAQWRDESGRRLNGLAATRFLEQNADRIRRLHDRERHNSYAASTEWRHERARKAHAVQRAKRLEDGDKPAPQYMEETDMPASRDDPRQIAYDLWCLQEDRLRAGQPLESMDTLVRELQARNPRLDAAIIHRGVEHLLARLFAENEVSLARRQRWIFHASLSSVPARRASAEAPAGSSLEQTRASPR